MRKGLFIYNPRSGSRNVNRRLDEILGHAQKRGLFLMPMRMGTDQESENLLKTSLLLPWIEFVIAAGGDGTLGAIAKLILENRPELPMGIIPSGTCNDFAESLRLPQDELDCIDVVVDNHMIQLDVGQVNQDKMFLSTCAAGMFVNVSFNTNSDLKQNLGPLAYYFQALGEFAHIRSFPMRIETENTVIEDNFLLFLILNGPQGAGFPNLYSKARMHDGLMDMILIRECPKLEMALLLVELLNRNLSEGKWIKHIQAREFKISSPEAVHTTLDGEEGLPLPFEIKVFQEALTVFVTERR